MITTPCAVVVRKGDTSDGLVLLQLADGHKPRAAMIVEEHLQTILGDWSF